jgi:tubulin-specific chaperone D
LLTASSDSETFRELPFSSKEYFEFLFALCNTASLRINAAVPTITAENCTSSLLAGLVTSADTGNEDLVIVTRAALAEFGEASDENLRQVCGSLLYNLKLYAGQDRVLVPTLEVVAFLFHVGILQHCCAPALTNAVKSTNTGTGAGAGTGSGSTFRLNLKQLCLLVQKAGYKTGNVRKLEACIKVYGAIAAVETRTTQVSIEQNATRTSIAAHINRVSTEGGIEQEQEREDTGGNSGNGTTKAGRLATAKRFAFGGGGPGWIRQEGDEGPAEARKRLGALLLHPFPKVRSLVVDELWNLLALGSGHGIDDDEVESGREEEGKNLLLGVDWGRADKARVKKLVSDLRLG